MPNSGQQEMPTVTRGSAVVTSNLSPIPIKKKWSHPSSQDVPELMTATEVGTLLKINVKTIYSYVRRGLIPYVKIQSNVRFPKDAILHWVEQQSYQPGTVHSLDRTPPRPEADSL